MPWRTTDVLTERGRFCVRLEQGERMVDLCREYGISRTTGHKFWKRYQQSGLSALEDHSRRAWTFPHRTPKEIVALVVAARKKHPTWGPKKLKVVLEQRHPTLKIPAHSTIGDILTNAGMVKPRRGRRKATYTPSDQLTAASAPNEVWCIDFKGQFRLGNGNYCYPLTITDLYSRYVIGVTALEGIHAAQTAAAMDLVFSEYGLPTIIRSDNGTPFASAGLLGFSSLNVWWARLGIQHQRIQPGKPQQNGQHERMHRTLKAETTKPPCHNILQQQAAFDRWRHTFNRHRPHEALGQKTPASIFKASATPYPDFLDDPQYALCDEVKTIGRGGHLRFNNKSFYISKALATQDIGIVYQSHPVVALYFIDQHIGHINNDRFET